jgi:hypothetical protein
MAMLRPSNLTVIPLTVLVGDRGFRRGAAAGPGDRSGAAQRQWTGRYSASGRGDTAPVDGAIQRQWT